MVDDIFDTEETETGVPAEETPDGLEPRSEQPYLIVVRGDASARLGGEFIDPRGDVLTRPQSVPMSSGLVWGTLVPRCAVRFGRAFAGCEGLRKELVAFNPERRHRRNST